MKGRTSRSVTRVARTASCVAVCLADLIDRMPLLQLASHCVLRRTVLLALLRGSSRLPRPEPGPLLHEQCHPAKVPALPPNASTPTAPRLFSCVHTNTSADIHELGGGVAFVSVWFGCIDVGERTWDVVVVACDWGCGLDVSMEGRDVGVLQALGGERV